MLTCQFDRLKHLTCSTVYANDRCSLTVDEVHDTILSSHTTNIVVRTWLVSSEVILDVRDYPVVLQRETTTDRILVLLFLTNYNELDASSITYELEAIEPTSNCINSNFLTDWESNWIKNHLVANSFVTKSVLNSWVVVRIVRNDLQTRNRNASSEVFELGVSNKSSQVLESNYCRQLSCLSALYNSALNLRSTTVHNLKTLSNNTLTYFESWLILCVNEDTASSVLDVNVFARDEVNHTSHLGLGVISHSLNLCDSWDVLNPLCIKSTSSSSVDSSNFSAREVSSSIPSVESRTLFVRSIQYPLSSWLSWVSKSVLPEWNECLWQTSSREVS